MMRFIFLLLLLPCLAWASVPRKSEPVVQYRTFSFSNPGIPLDWASSPVAACEPLLAQTVAANGGQSGRFSVASYSYCTILDSGAMYFSRGVESQNAEHIFCPPGASLDGAVCNCDKGYIEDPTHMFCVQDEKCPPLKGQSTYITVPGRAMPGSSQCGANGCSITMSPFVLMLKDKSTGKWESQGDASFTGSSCSGDPSASASPTDCKGGVKGTVNGVEVCAPPSDRNVVESVKSSTSTETASPPSSSSSAPETVTKTTTTSTVCDAGNCTTTITTVTSTPSSQSTSTKTEEVDKQSFCKENPESTVCKAGKFGGVCSSGFTCDGDAIQCAMAKEQHQRNCQLYDPDTDPASAVNRALAGDDPGNVDKMKAAAKASPLNVGTFDFSGRGWSRTCPDDPSFSLSWAHGSATEWKLPFSKLCTPLGLAADVAVAITALGCAVFVLRGGGE